MSGAKSRRWLVRAAIAASITLAFVSLYAPPNYVAEQFAIRPGWISAEILAIFAIAFAAIAVGDTVALWARRGPRTLRPSGIVSFVTGVLCGLFALSLWFAFLSVPVAPIGIAAAAIALRKETTNGEGHSLLNLAGLFLNVVALGFVLAQVISATLWP